MTETRYRWHFPPRNGGVEIINDPSAAFFKDNPIPKLVREVIQNSLDAKEPGISDPVCVTFDDVGLERQLIGASQLYRHLTACLKRSVDEDRSESIRSLYEGAVEALKNSHIRCLQITDTNTTGLTGKRWDALVTQEGSVEKSDAGAPGGSFGIGKNAVFNVSDIQTVFYSTQYVDRRQGRVDLLQGKATLMAHQNPENPGESLQHTGFFTNANGLPMEGRRNIPPPFQLEEPGTGVYIMGFNPMVADWVGDIIRAVLRNFFHAIHHKALVVRIKSDDNEVMITNEDLEPLFERYAKNEEAFDYYRAVRDSEVIVTDPVRTIGTLDLYIKIDGGPKRMAYVNRNGMLITDSREKKDNPLPPNNRSLWPDFAGVIIPSTDAGDRRMRQMENPSHDAISVSQLREESEQRKMARAFESARRIIRQVMDERTHLAQSGNQANLRELAEMFPELDPTQDGVISLVTREITPRNVDLPFFTESGPDDAGNDGDLVDSDSEGSANGGHEGEQAGDGELNDTDGDKGNVRGEGDHGTRASRASIRNVRIVSKEANKVVVALDPGGKAPHQIKFVLRPAGEEYQNADSIEIASATLMQASKGQQVALKGNVVELSATDATRTFVELETAESVDNVAFRMGVYR